MKKHGLTLDEMFDLIEPDVVDIPEDEFDEIYDQLVAIIETVGTYSDGGTEAADFSSSRWVDPANQILVEVDDDSDHLIPAVVDAVERDLKPKRRFSIGFMGHHQYGCVIKDGDSQHHPGA